MQALAVRPGAAYPHPRWSHGHAASPGAVELFVDRARLASASFAPTDGERQVIDELCRRLDGLPLAVELVAAWVRLLSPGEILDHLDTAWPVLTGHAVHGPPADLRHRTMDAAISSSYQLLEPGERGLFERLAVFPGRFDLAAAYAVAGDDADVLGRLGRLVDQSLVTPEPAPDAPTTYRMLEPVRRYGSARLADRPDHESIRSAHAEHCLRIVQRSSAALAGPDRAAALGALVRDEANLVLALAWARRHRPDIALLLCAGVSESWLLQAWRADLDDVVDAALEADVPARRRATNLSAAARVLARRGETPRAAALLRDSLRIVEDQGDRAAAGRRLRDLATVAMASGDPAGATEAGEQAVALLRGEGDARRLASALMALGIACHAGGDPGRGDQHLSEAVARHREAGNRTALAYGLLGLAYGAWSMGDAARQRTCLTEAVEHLRASGNLDERIWLNSATMLAATELRVRNAVRLAGAALQAVERRGYGGLSPALELPRAKVLHLCLSAVGDVLAERLMAEGAALTVDELVAEALAEPSTGATGATGATADGLSRRERQLAELVGDGLTNAEIAGKLFISKRTVETHVRHVKEKLGLATRSEIILWAHRDRPALH